VAWLCVGEDIGPVIEESWVQLIAVVIHVTLGDLCSVTKLYDMVPL